MGVIIGISDLMKVKIGFDHADVKRKTSISNGTGWVTRVTLWGENARNLKRDCFDRKEKSNVLIITSVFVETYKGSFWLSSTDATKGMTITCKGTVKGVKMKTPWYYLACTNCSPARAELKALDCIECTCSEPNVEPRFKLELEVFGDDEYGSASLTALGDLAVILFDDNKKVSRLKGLMYTKFLDKEEILSDEVPMLRHLDNRRFVFELEIVQRGDDRTIILKGVYPINHELENRYELEQRILRFRASHMAQTAKQQAVKIEPDRVSKVHLKT